MNVTLNLNEADPCLILASWQMGNPRVVCLDEVT